MAANITNGKQIDGEKALRLLIQLWAHQNGVTINELTITKKEKEGE